LISYQPSKLQIELVKLIRGKVDIGEGPNERVAEDYGFFPFRGEWGGSNFFS
jgi:hypothetical protein